MNSANSSVEIYNSYATNRFTWQRQAIAEIKKRLSVYPPLHNLQENQEERFVITCGFPQSGKTEIVLSLLRIAPEYRQQIYALTRAGQKNSHSSTVTATNYYRSNSDYFEIFAAFDGDAQVKQLNEDEVKPYLQQVRNRIEEGERLSEILRIGFPSRFFLPETDSVRLNIVDLPGVFSSNKKEEPHAQRMFQKYFPLASVVLLVCPASDVAKMESGAVAKLLSSVSPDWASNAERFMVVLTRAFSDNTIPMHKPDTPFSPDLLCEEYAQKCIDALKQHLPNLPLQAFPMELGDSLNSLYNNVVFESYGPTLWDEIRTYSENAADKMRSAITQRQNRMPLQAILQWSSTIQQIRKKEEEAADVKLKDLLHNQRQEQRGLEQSSNLVEALSEGLDESVDDCEFASKIQHIQAIKDPFRQDVNQAKSDCYRVFQQCLQKQEKVTSQNTKEIYTAVENYWNTVQPILENTIDLLPESIDSNHVPTNDTKRPNKKDFTYPFGFSTKLFQRSIPKKEAGDAIRGNFRKYLKNSGIQLLVQAVYRLFDEEEDRLKNEKRAHEKQQAAKLDLLKKFKNDHKQEINRLEDDITVATQHQQENKQNAQEAEETMRLWKTIVTDVFAKELALQTEQLYACTTPETQLRQFLFIQLINWDYENLMKL